MNIVRHCSETVSIRRFTVRSAFLNKTERRSISMVTVHQLIFAQHFSSKAFSIQKTVKMSLAISYSSDEDDTPVSTSGDAFGISELPSSKKPRVENSKGPTSIVSSAPDVLLEVCTNYRLIF